MQHMTPKPPPKEMAAWLRRLEAASARHKAARDALSEVIADARSAGVPLTTIEKHVPYSREWARKLADEVDERRAELADLRANEIREQVAAAERELDIFRVE